MKNFFYPSSIFVQYVKVIGIIMTVKNFLQDYYYLTMHSPFSKPSAMAHNYFRNKSPLAELAASTLSVSLATKVKVPCSKPSPIANHKTNIKTQSVFINQSEGARADISGKSLRERIDKRLRSGCRKGKENRSDNKPKEMLEKSNNDQRQSFIRKMLFVEDCQQAKTNTSTIKNRSALRTQFQQRQQRALTMRQQRAELLLRREEQQLRQCTFKPKLTKYHGY